MTYVRYVKLGLILITVLIGLFFNFISTASTRYSPVKVDVKNLNEAPPVPQTPFSPSNARTADGKTIPSSEFISAKRCATCHQDIYEEWAESLHRNSAREPFYKASVDILERQRRIEFTRHCESCHAPVATMSGALTVGSTEPREMDDEGVTCTVCHSITEARLDGTGSYTIRRPALIEHSDSTFEYGNVSDGQILANIEGHKRAMMRPVLRQAEFCATCHKAAAPPELNNYKFLRGFNAYDEWQMSGASTDTITPYYRRDKRADCRTCHMPAVSSDNDAAAKKGVVFSHRFLGANTMTPHFYGQHKQVELTKKFLADNVLTVDIFAVKNESDGRVYNALAPESGNNVAFKGGQSVTADVVVFNRKAAHSFPPELRDMYEPWVEFEVTDSAGSKIFHSGFINPDKSLDEKAHVYKALLLDSRARVITRHQVWNAAIKAYDNFIPPGRSDLVRYNFSIPKDFKAGQITLRAAVHYRRFIHEYTQFVLKMENRESLDAPIVKMAESVTHLNGASKTSAMASGSSVKEAIPLPRRWNDYAISLLDQGQYDAAREAFLTAGSLDPKNPDPVISAAISELRMERYSIDRDQVNRAGELIDRALKIDPDSNRAKFYRAVVMRASGRLEEAASEFAKLSVRFPRDREVQRQLGQTLFTLNRFFEARIAFEKIREIDPTDSGAHQFLSAVYANGGEDLKALEAEKLYLLWRDDPSAESIAASFYMSNPQWTEVRIPYHVKSIFSPKRATHVGVFAAPGE